MADVVQHEFQIELTRQPDRSFQITRPLCREHNRLLAVQIWKQCLKLQIALGQCRRRLLVIRLGFPFLAFVLCPLLPVVLGI